MLKNKKIIVGVIIIIIGLGIILFMNFNRDTSNTIKKSLKGKKIKNWIKMIVMDLYQI